MAGVVDVKILRAPARDVVKRAGGFDAPCRRGVVRIAHLNGSNERTIKLHAQKAIHGMKIFRDASGFAGRKFFAFIAPCRNSCSKPSSPTATKFSARAKLV